MGYKYYTEMIKPMISIMIVEVFIDMFFLKTNGYKFKQNIKRIQIS